MSRPLGRCVLTGASGFLGSRLVGRLAGEGVSRWTRERVDLCDSDAVAAAIAEDAPDTVFHLAADAVRTPGADDPGIVTRNVAMAENLVRAVRPGARVIVAGSLTEYGRSGRLAETDSCTPQTAYNRGKLEAGRRAIALGAERGVEVIVARLFHLYGPGEPPHRLMPSLLAALEAGRPVALSDGLQRRDYLHVDDAADALIGLARLDHVPEGEAPIVNVGTGEALMLRDVALWAARSLGVDPALLRFGERPRSPADEELLVADTGRLQRWLGAIPPARLMGEEPFAALMRGAPQH